MSHEKQLRISSYKRGQPLTLDRSYVPCQGPVAQTTCVFRNAVSLAAPLRAVYPLRLGIHSICELVLCTQTTQIALRDVLPRQVGSQPCSKSRIEKSSSGSNGCKRGIWATTRQGLIPTEPTEQSEIDNQGG
jgi:hypothetical protein